jgi:two-component system response regulator MtrA
MKNSKALILCVDDDQDLLDSMRIILEGHGYAVETATTALEGIHLFKTAHPDLILVDLMMEEVDSGVTLVRDLKALGVKLPPIYMLSSVGDGLNLNVDFSELGLTGVLQKPINPDSLAKTIAAQLKAAE